jgi:hypothetical protein
MEETYSISFNTPCFCRGMDNREDANPEIRPASIRGHLRSWYRALFADPAGEKQIFGGVGRDAVSSPLVIRVANLQGEVDKRATLPHKQGGHAAPKNAFLPGTSFDLLVSTRRQGINEAQEEKVKQAIRAWFLAGGLGLRVTRAAGSIQWDGLPSTKEDYQKLLSNELRFDGSPIHSALVLPYPYNHPEKARVKASDTIGGRDDRSGQDDLRRMNYPLGTLGSRRDNTSRKTSPLRLSVRQFDDGYRIVMHWYDAGGDKPNWKELTKLLVAKDKFLGTDIIKAFQGR